MLSQGPIYRRLVSRCPNSIEARRNALSVSSLTRGGPPDRWGRYAPLTEPRACRSFDIETVL